MFCVLGLACAAVPAAEWSAAPTFSLGTDFDTNRRLTDPASESQAAQFGATVTLARVTATHKLSLRPRFEARRYDKSNQVLDSNDGGVDLRFVRQGERSTFTASATAAEDSTLTTELADTGIVEGSARRRLLTAGADVTMAVGERSRVQAGASFVDVDFDDAVGTGLAPYSYPGVFLGVSLDATDRTQLSFTANGSRFDSPTTRTNIDNFSVRATWQSQVSEQFRLELNGGVNRSESAFAHEQGPVFGVTGSWNTPRTSLSFGLARDVEPSANGRMVKADSVEGSWRWNLGERTTLTTALRHARREDLLFGQFLERREYSTLHAALGWRLNMNWNLQLRAGVASQSYERSGFEADGERIALSFSWAPDKYAVSR